MNFTPTDDTFPINRWLDPCRKLQFIKLNSRRLYLCRNNSLKAFKLSYDYCNALINYMNFRFPYPVM